MKPEQVNVLQAVRNGAANLKQVASATRYPVRKVQELAVELQGEFLCCLDGEPWALTVSGLRVTKPPFRFTLW